MRTGKVNASKDLHFFSPPAGSDWEFTGCRRQKEMPSTLHELPSPLSPRVSAFFFPLLLLLLLILFGCNCELPALCACVMHQRRLKTTQIGAKLMVTPKRPRARRAVRATRPPGAVATDSVRWHKLGLD